MERLGEFVYNGNGETLENDVTYTLFETDSQIEAYPGGSGEPVEINKGGVFNSLESNLESLGGVTTME